MKSFLAMTAAAVAFGGLFSPALAAPTDLGFDIVISGDVSADEFDRKGRRPRVPGGSGCDSPRDVREHPECRR